MIRIATRLAPAMAIAEAVSVSQDTTSTPDSCYLRSSFTDECPSGWELLGNLCYEPADAGHRCIGEECYKDCPSGYTDSVSDILDPYSILQLDDLNLPDLPVSCTLTETKTTYIRSCRWSGPWYRRRRSCDSCASGYNRIGDLCIPSYSCPSGMSGDGITCSKEHYDRNVEEATCANGTERDPWPACFGECPSGTTLCGTADTGLLCLNDTEDCVDYTIDFATYIARWIAAGSTGNAVEIADLIISGEHERYDHDVCAAW